jgi:nucleoside-diphosphate-sugar epimerase
VTDPAPFPSRFPSVASLEDFLSAPRPETVASFAALGGDLVVLGAGGKMGPTLARLARRSLDAAGSTARVIAVSRFADGAVRTALEAHGVETVACDLLDDGALDSLPDAAGAMYLVGRKFGSAGNEEETWAVNAFLPGLAMRRYRGARVVALSTGNVYPFVNAAYRGAKEDGPVAPVGEYAQSCLGRERVMAYASARHGTPLAIVRLNYAVELRYGVLLDIARKVRAGEEIDLRTGYVNVIWQGDASAAALQAFDLCSVPPATLNVTGYDALNVRHLATAFGDIFDREPVFVGREEDTALLSDAARFHERMPFRKVPVDAMIRWIVAWIESDGPTYDKPTRYETRDGIF